MIIARFDQACSIGTIQKEYFQAQAFSSIKGPSKCSYKIIQPPSNQNLSNQPSNLTMKTFVSFD